jgi:hypothetical protein
VLCEANTGGAGRVVIRKCTENPLRLEGYQREKIGLRTRATKNWYSFARQMVNSDGLELNDPQTIQELMHVREERGRIEGQDGYHDDHADAFVLAVWACRRLPGFNG